MSANAMEPRNEREALLAEARSAWSGLEWSRRLSALIDRVITEAFTSFQHGMRPSLVAVGSYGRRELGPASDVDIVVLPGPLTDAAATDAYLRALHSALVAAITDSFGLRLDYSVRSHSDIKGLDPKSQTALLDSRLIVGSATTFDHFIQDFWTSLPVGDFLVHKIKERQLELARSHESPLVVEPDLKIGAGGLRSFQSSNWLRLAIGERHRPLPEEYDTIIAARNGIQALANSARCVLTRPMQGQIADAYGLLPQDLTDRVLSATSYLHEDALSTLNHIHAASFEIRPGVLAGLGEVKFKPKVRLGDAAVGVLLADTLGLRVPTAQPPRSTDIRSDEALTAILSGEETIRVLDSSGILEALLPELTACRTLVPPDATHQFTVFEHTLRTVRYALNQPDSAFWTEVSSHIPRPELLILAILLHDTGKQSPDRPHSEVGGELAEQVGRRWGLGDTDVELVRWLVDHHLALARMVRIRDVQHPDTALELAELAQTVERLSYLSILTYADIAAVHDGAWNQMMEVQLAELYSRTLPVLQGHHSQSDLTGLMRRHVLRDLRASTVDPAAIDDFLSRMPAAYLEGSSAEIIQLHMEYVEGAQTGQWAIDVDHVREISATNLTVCTLDHQGLLGDILGVLYAAGVQLHSIRAFTTIGDCPIALDTFTISYGGRLLPDATARDLKEDLRAVLANDVTVDNLLRGKGRDPSMRQRDYRWTYEPGSPGILEVQAPPGEGMAFRLARLIASQGWNIQSARVGQWGGRAAATFYVTGPDHAVITSEQVNLALNARV